MHVEGLLAEVGWWQLAGAVTASVRGLMWWLEAGTNWGGSAEKKGACWQGPVYRVFVTSDSVVPGTGSRSPG